MTGLLAEYDIVAASATVLKQQSQKLNEMLDKHYQDFNSLQKPQRFIDSYPAILKEISRRNAFNKFITDEVYKTFEEYDAVIAREQQERLRFLKMHGEVIPQDFIPELKLQPCAIKGVNNILDKQELKLPRVNNHGPIRCA